METQVGHAPGREGAGAQKGWLGLGENLTKVACLLLFMLAHSL